MWQYCVFVCALPTQAGVLGPGPNLGQCTLQAVLGLLGKKEKTLVQFLCYSLTTCQPRCAFVNHLAVILIGGLPMKIHMLLCISLTLQVAASIGALGTSLACFTEKRCLCEDMGGLYKDSKTGWTHPQY